MADEADGASGAAEAQQELVQHLVVEEVDHDALVARNGEPDEARLVGERRSQLDWSKLAHRVLSTELEIGVMLPCNVLVYEGDDGKAVVLAIHPIATIASTQPGLAGIAGEVRAGLAKALEAV